VLSGKLRGAWSARFSIEIHCGSARFRAGAEGTRLAEGTIGLCRYGRQVRSTILTSQLPVARWHEQIGDPTLAYGILDRSIPEFVTILPRWDASSDNEDYCLLPGSPSSP
jgi:hypothetical protein